jgi:hypothetical protein
LGGEVKKPNLDWGQYSWDPETLTLEVDGITSSAFDAPNTQWRVTLQAMFSLKPLIEYCVTCARALAWEEKIELDSSTVAVALEHYRHWLTNRRMTSYDG